MANWSLHDNMNFKKKSGYEGMVQSYYIAKIKRLALNVYSWNIPGKELDPKLIERYLWDCEQCIVWRSPDIGICVTKANVTAYDGNGRPKRFKPVWDTPDANRVLSTPEQRVYDGTDDENICVPIYGMLSPDIMRRDCLFMTSQIADTNETIRQQVWNQKTPLIAIASNSSIRNKLKNVIQGIGDNLKAMVLDSDIKGEVQALNLNAPYNVESLEAEKSTIFNEMLEFIGIDSQEAYQKKERKVVDEQEANDETLNYLLADGLKPRQEACRMLADAFGITASVEVQRNVRPEAETKDMGAFDDPEAKKI